MTLENECVNTCFRMRQGMEGPRRWGSKCDCLRTRWLFSAVIHMLKRPRLCVLVHVSISQNGVVLTETCSPPPPGICNTKPAIAREHGSHF